MQHSTACGDAINMTHLWPGAVHITQSTVGRCKTHSPLVKVD